MNRFVFAAALLFTMSLSSSHAQSSLSADESRMVAFVDKSNDEALQLLERVVNINSGTQNLAGVREVGKVFQQQFDALGFKG